MLTFLLFPVLRQRMLKKIDFGRQPIHERFDFLVQLRHLALVEPVGFQRLLQRHQMFQPLISFQRLDDRFLAGPDRFMPQKSQRLGIPFSFQNGVDDPPPGHSRDIADHVLQL
jgi:hypothetical protein